MGDSSIRPNPASAPRREAAASEPTGVAGRRFVAGCPPEGDHFYEEVGDLKRALLCVVTASLLLVPTTAVGGKKSYTGTADADPTAIIDFKVKKKKGKRKFVSPSITNWPATCTDEGTTNNPQPRRISITGSGPTKVKDNGSFRWVAINPYVNSLIVKGKLEAGKTAGGTAQFSGDYTIEGTTYDCKTGKVDWSASA